MALDKEKFEQDFNRHIEKNAEKYIKELAEAVAIKSVSSDLANHLGDVEHMLQWTKDYIERLNGKAELLSNPASTPERALPPILIGEFISDPKKKTLCVYGHLDVQPAARGDGWDTDPFVLTEKDGKLFGRGSTDDKGPALSWLWVIEAHQQLGVELPVNVKLIYEGMEEYGSDGMFETIAEEAKPGKFLNDVDFFCISDNYWLGKRTPCITYGLRGLAYFEISVQCTEQDLHSGVLGGTVHEAMTDLVHLMASLIEPGTGKILVDGIMDDVAEVTEEELKLYEDIDFDIEEYKDDCKVKSVSDTLLNNDKISLLMGRWRYPSLTLHGIEGAFSDTGAKTVIPAKVIGKFSMRLVPDQSPEKIGELTETHLKKVFEELNSPNKLEVKLVHGAKAWLSSTTHPNYEAASKAIQRVYGQKPDFTREGGSIPITSAFEDSTQMNVLLLPIGASDDMAHSTNEKYNRSNLLKGVYVLGLYLHELGEIKGPKPSLCRCEPLTEEELMVPGAFLKGFMCKCEM